MRVILLMESAFILQEPLHVAIKQKALKQLQLNKGQITAGAVKGKSLTYYHGSCRKGRIFMKIREKIIQYLYDLANNESLCEDMHKAFVEMEDLCEKYFAEGKEDDYMNGICNIEQTAFFAGANMVLDFISGKEVQ